MEEVFTTNGSEKNPNPIKIGLAYSCQQFDGIVAESHDIKLDYVISEKNIRVYKSTLICNNMNNLKPYSDHLSNREVKMTRKKSFNFLFTLSLQAIKSLRPFKKFLKLSSLYFRLKDQI